MLDVIGDKAHTAESLGHLRFFVTSDGESLACQSTRMAAVKAVLHRVAGPALVKCFATWLVTKLADGPAGGRPPDRSARSPSLGE